MENQSKSAEVLQLPSQVNTIVFQRMGIPSLYRSKSLSNLRGLSQEKAACIEAVKNRKSIFISGRAGVGKTHLAVGSIIEWLKAFKPAHSSQYPVFLPAAEFFVELKDTFGGSGSEKDVLDRYSKTPLLCIDDIGAEKISDWSRQMFYTLIDRRYREEKQTIVTSNLDLEMIAKLIDDRISSRIVGMGIVLNLTGEDYRLNQ